MKIVELVANCKNIIYKLENHTISNGAVLFFDRNTNHSDRLIIRYQGDTADGYDLTNQTYSTIPKLQYTSSVNSIILTFPQDVVTKDLNLKNCIYASQTGVNPWLGFGEEKIKQGFDKELIIQENLMFVEYSADVFPKLLFSVPKDGQTLIFRGHCQDHYKDYNDFIHQFPQLDFLQHLKDVVA